MQLYFFCYHKVATVLISRVLERFSHTLGWTTDFVFGLARNVDKTKTAIQFKHSLIGFDLADYPHKGVRFIRDPRDIWLSGYLYHRRCQEQWCTNTNLSLESPIRFPQVPYSRQHCSEEWKRDYVANLGGRSYQQSLNILDQDAGLHFEMERYTDWTMSAMAEWVPDPHTIDVRMEDLMADFDGVFLRMLRHCGVNASLIPQALAIAAMEDISRMSDTQVATNPHIHSRSISKWRSTLTPDQVAAFEARHGNLIRALGYPLSHEMPEA